jgi:hypothetical protein
MNGMAVTCYRESSTARKYTDASCAAQGRIAGMVKKILTWGGVAFLIFFIAFRPASAAEVFKSIGSGIMDIATGFGDFFTNLVA